MLTEDELRRLMADLESDRVERTISTNKTDKHCRAICAFANDLPGHGRPGYLLVGVDDDGRPSGLQVTDQLLQNLAANRDNGRIQPLPAMSVARFVLEEGEVAVVEVEPSDIPPVRYDGRIHIRVGPRRAVASEQEERILVERRTSGFKTFDLRPCRGATMADLVMDLFVQYRSFSVAPDVVEENHRAIELQMASLSLYDLGTQAPTYAGMLILGKELRRWLPGAYVQFVRFDGCSLADDARDEKLIDGDLLTVLRELDGLIKLQTTGHPTPVSAAREKMVWDYPPFAVRELVMNAVMHRDYEAVSPTRFYWFDDHIEIQNPGGLYGAATRENFPRQNAYRNPIVAAAMKAFGFVNTYGHGVVRAQRILAENGNPPAEFEFQDTFVLAKLTRSS
jgi:ATP-dependent DNA helicase RecG